MDLKEIVCEEVDCIQPAQDRSRFHKRRKISLPDEGLSDSLEGTCSLKSFVSDRMTSGI
jgi:hypothetical protein